MTPGLGAGGREHLARGQREGERVRRILRQLLDFSSPPRGARVPIELARLCEETAALVRAQRRYAQIRIEVAAEGEPPPALADPSGVAQIVLNLLLNAADALCQGSPEPRIRVTRAPGPGPRAGGRPGPRGRRLPAPQRCGRVRGRGQRPRDRGGRPRAGLRSFLHDQAAGGGHRARARERRALRGGVRREPRAAPRPARGRSRLRAAASSPDGGFQLPTHERVASRAAQCPAYPARGFAAGGCAGASADPRESQATRGLGRRRAHGTRLAQGPGQREERGRSDVSAGTQSGVHPDRDDDRRRGDRHHGEPSSRPCSRGEEATTAPRPPCAPSRI